MGPQKHHLLCISVFLTKIRLLGRNVYLCEVRHRDALSFVIVCPLILVTAVNYSIKIRHENEKSLHLRAYSACRSEYERLPRPMHPRVCCSRLLIAELIDEQGQYPLQQTRDLARGCRGSTWPGTPASSRSDLDRQPAGRGAGEHRLVVDVVADERPRPSRRCARPGSPPRPPCPALRRRRCSSTSLPPNALSPDGKRRPSVVRPPRAPRAGRARGGSAKRSSAPLSSTVDAGLDQRRRPASARRSRIASSRDGASASGSQRILRHRGCRRCTAA